MEVIYSELMKELLQPAIFIGHGSPMNAVANNSYTQFLQSFSATLQKPKAILCISAHWETPNAPYVTSAAQPRTIHDFYGFPQELFEIQYPASGSEDLAKKIISILGAQSDSGRWGLDHGAWSVLKHLFPLADVPVLQLSLQKNQNYKFHFELGKKLHSLREEGVLLLGSGNLVHNLRKISWDTQADAWPWAREFSSWAEKKLQERDFASLVELPLDSEHGRLSIPTDEHYLPALYILGACSAQDNVKILYNEIQNASISMLSFAVGMNG